MSSLRTLFFGLLGAVAVTAGLAAQEVRDTIGPLEKQAKPITPENPIPRRTFSVPAPYPAEARGIDAAGAVSLVATLDDAGRVVEIRKVREPLLITQSPSQNPTAVRIAAEAMVRDAAGALRRWTYDPPANGPISFLVTFSFKPDADATTTQSTSVPGGMSGGGATGLASAGPNQPVRVGGNIKAPVQLNKVAPVYPAEAQQARVQGIVILETTLGIDGRVSDARVLRSVPMLDQAALDAVKQWEYTPTLLNGVPTPVIMTVTVSFTLPPLPTSQPQQ